MVTVLTWVSLGNILEIKAENIVASLKVQPNLTLKILNGDDVKLKIETAPLTLKITKLEN